MRRLHSSKIRIDWLRNILLRESFLNEIDSSKKNSLLKITLVTFVLILSACASVRDNSAVWIDVRTDEEYNEDHIDGDMNIPLQVIDVDEFASMFSKDDEINLYCRSGNRAGQAKLILEAAGFTKVNNMGGIGDARELRNLAAQSAAP